VVRGWSIRVCWFTEAVGGQVVVVSVRAVTVTIAMIQVLTTKCGTAIEE